MTTGARGEAVLKVGEREVPILFTNRALANAERAIGRTVLEIARESLQGSMGIGDTAALLQAGMEAARRDRKAGGMQVTVDDAYAVMDEAGFAMVGPALLEALVAVLGYGLKDDEEPADPPA